MDAMDVFFLAVVALAFAGFMSAVAYAMSAAGPDFPRGSGDPQPQAEAEADEIKRAA